MTPLKTLQNKYFPLVAPEDFFVLLAQATGKEKVFLLAHPEYELTKKQTLAAERYLKRRLQHEPVAYIIGHKEFYGRDFLVTKDTLIPRPETELLIESALNAISKLQVPISKNIDIIDVGTGSGNIIITLAKEIEKAHQTTNTSYHALDTSSHALSVARENATRHHAAPIAFIKSDLLQNFPVPQEKNHHVVIVANLPYLSEKIYNESAPDVRDFEPHSALFSDKQGLAHYLRLLQELAPRLAHYHAVVCFFEISPEQSDILPARIHTYFPAASIQIFPDLSGKNRLIQATLKQ